MFEKLSEKPVPLFVKPVLSTVAGGRGGTPRRGVRLIAGGYTPGEGGSASSPLRPGGAREKAGERTLSERDGLHPAGVQERAG